MTLKISNAEAINLLGRQQDDSKIVHFLNQLGLSWIDLKVSDKDIMNRFKELKDYAIGINFEDIGQLRDVKFHDIGDGPYILEKITCWGYNKNFSGQANFPVDGLSFDSSIEDVIAKLGPPSKRSDDATRPIQWLREGYKLVIQWTEDPRKIRNITYWLTDLEEKSKAFR